MQQQPTHSHTPALADTDADTDITETAIDAAGTPERDPAGGIKLSGRNRLNLRAAVLAGVTVTSGIVVALSAAGADTTSSCLSALH